MKTIINIIREEVSKVIKEAQKIKNIGEQVNKFLSDSEPYLKEDVKSTFNLDMVKPELGVQINSVIDRIQRKSFDYSNMFIVKLGRFKIKNGKQVEDLYFKLNNSDTDIINFTFLFIFRDTISFFGVGHSFFTLDKKLIKQAEDLIVQIEGDVKFKGEIIINEEFSKDIILDLTDYSLVKAVKPNEKDEVVQKSDIFLGKYVSGKTIINPKFGKGKISKTKTIGYDDEGNRIVRMQVEFPGGIKTLQLKDKG
jgi:hypothetical protein